MKPYPLTTAYNDVQTARTSAVLAAAGAYDTTPLTLACPGFEWVTLFFKYTRGAIGGNFAFKIEGQRPGNATDWYQATRYAGGAVTTGTDVSSDVQQEEVEYGSGGAAAELFIYGPLRIVGALDKLRVNAKETGVTATPGTLEAIAVFS